MKILHTSDWHLGKKLETFSRLEEQRQVLNEICEITREHDVDAVIIAGDIYDQFNPPIEAEELFYNTARRLSENKRPVICIAGNHDSAERIDAPEILARQNGILMAGKPWPHIRPFEFAQGVRITRSAPGYVEIFFDKYNYSLRLLINPYANEFRLREHFKEIQENDFTKALPQLLNAKWLEQTNEYCNDEGVNVLCAHFVMLPSKTNQGKKIETDEFNRNFEEPENEKPILHIGGIEALSESILPPPVQYAALGHLHRSAIFESGRAAYSGSILPYSFSEAEQTKGVIIADIEPAKTPGLQFVPLKSGRQLIRKRFTNIQSTLEWLGDNKEALVELTLAFDDYISAGERKEIAAAHKGIVSIIPEVQGAEDEHETVNLSRDTNALFQEYFQKRHGQTPPPDLMEIFKEVNSL